jgi:hypothetical protein
MSAGDWQKNLIRDPVEAIKASVVDNFGPFLKKVTLFKWFKVPLLGADRWGC